MPYSLVLNLLPQSSISKEFLQGINLHGLFFELVHHVNPELSSYLHKDFANKPFTISPLQTKTFHESLIHEKSSIVEKLQFIYSHDVPVQTPCWWRISLLDDLIFHELKKIWLNPDSNFSWSINDIKLKLCSVLMHPTSEQPWANHLSYEEIYQLASDQERKINFQIFTPATFRVFGTKYDSPLPDKSLVFNSLLNRWNTFSNIPFKNNIIEPIFPANFDLKTFTIEDKRSKFIGAVGTITFQIFGDVSPTIIKQLNTLADFAFFSGVGRKTTMGMGILKRVFNNSNKFYTVF